MAKPLSDADIDAALSDLPGWARSGDTITKTYKFHHFPEAFSFLTRVAFAAEEANHHPQIHNVWATVKLTLCTHDAGDKVTRKDIDLAKTIAGFNWLGK